jgi:hypothetical protein
MAARVKGVALAAVGPWGIEHANSQDDPHRPHQAAK